MTEQLQNLKENSILACKDESKHIYYSCCYYLSYIHQIIWIDIILKFLDLYCVWFNLFCRNNCLLLIALRKKKLFFQNFPQTLLLVRMKIDIWILIIPLSYLFFNYVFSGPFNLFFNCCTRYCPPEMLPQWTKFFIL